MLVALPRLSAKGPGAAGRPGAQALNRLTLRRTASTPAWAATTRAIRIWVWLRVETMAGGKQKTGTILRFEAATVHIRQRRCHSS